MLTDVGAMRVWIYRASRVQSCCRRRSLADRPAPVGYRKPMVALISADGRARFPAITRDTCPYGNPGLTARRATIGLCRPAALWVVSDPSLGLKWVACSSVLRATRA
jgi:hypothetical protein